MADNNSSRSQRPGEPSWRGTGAFRSSGGAAGEDPLAELARLIGQDDSFDKPAQRRPRAMDPRDPPAPRDPSGPSGSADWRKIAAAMRPYEPVDDAQEVPNHRELPEALRELSRRSSATRDEKLMRGVDPAPRPDPTHFLDREQEDRFSDPRAHEHFPARREHEHFPDPRQDEHLPDPRQDDHFPGPRQDEHQYAQPGFEHEDVAEPSLASDTHEEEQYESEPGDSADEPYYDEGDPMGPRDDYVYDDPPRSRGRNGLITAVTLIGCAILGTAGAYGYRTYYAGSGPDKIPPIITAETMPSKIVPSADSQPSKSFQDRLGEQGQERVVSREEQPLDLPSPPMPPAPRIVLPAPVAPSQPPAATPAHGGQQTTSSVSSPPSGLGAGIAAEPKRVHTVTIRPDGADVDSAPISVRPPATTQPATARQTSAPKSIPAPRTAAPLSLDPQANASELSPPAQDRVASAPATVPASPSQNAASPMASGGYTVQLSSQRNEVDAQSTFRGLQAKFPDLLGSRSPLIRRVDLGDKGVYYRTLVGPFATSDEASRFCSSYKAAGGQCIVPRN